MTNKNNTRITGILLGFAAALPACAFERLEESPALANRPMRGTVVAADNCAYAPGVP